MDSQLRSPSVVIILAAGQGTRMKSERPKVLHEILGRPLVGHVVAAAQGSGAGRVVVVTGYGRDQVSAYLGAHWPGVLTTVQEEQNGTGHAVNVTLTQLREQGVEVSGGPVLVLNGDAPLLTSDTLTRLTAAHEEQAAAVTVLSALLDDPTGYGRIIRDDEGRVIANTEHADADEQTRQINEINSGMYAFDPVFLVDGINRIGSHNAQGEQYLPDLIALARDEGLVVSAVPADDVQEIEGVNNRQQLAACGKVLQRRVNGAWMRAGVTMTDPDTTYIDAAVELQPDVVLEPGVILRGATEIAAGAVVGPDCTLIDTEVDVEARVNRTHAELAVIGPRAEVGPFTRLRPGTKLAADSKAGSYVEIKNSQIGEGAKVPHLSYVGDATVGARTNIGAATVFVNYDGVSKHHTDIGEEVRIGSDTMLVAPVTIGDGAYTAAGSVITEDVPPGGLGIGRGRQRNVDHWVTRNRPDSPSAAAARASEEEDGQ